MLQTKQIESDGESGYIQEHRQQYFNKLHANPNYWTYNTQMCIHLS